MTLPTPLLLASRARMCRRVLQKGRWRSRRDPFAFAHITHPRLTSRCSNALCAECASSHLQTNTYTHTHMPHAHCIKYVCMCGTVLATGGAKQPRIAFCARTRVKRHDVNSHMVGMERQCGRRILMLCVCVCGLCGAAGGGGVNQSLVVLHMCACGFVMCGRNAVLLFASGWSSLGRGLRAVRPPFGPGMADGGDERTRT